MNIENLFHQVRLYESTLLRVEDEKSYYRYIMLVNVIRYKISSLTFKLLALVKIKGFFIIIYEYSLSFLMNCLSNKFKKMC